ncbi:flowering time control protein FPA-like [Cornus florida]|uniref:flowering time control protein FPA-like n=1 Tax=Cornus florida TaxID=4283 RepID=UPI00289D9617|nr:flowering time control protein FPA-like [Cornus florida]
MLNLIKSEKKADQNPKQTQSGKDSDEAEEEPPSNNLWVGNLSSDVTDSDLVNLFGKHGALDTVTSYASRCYGFIYFERAEDAKAAKNALQGTFFHGNQIKIEFSRPAKPCKGLWVSGINASFSKDKLEEEFLKFGKIEEFKFLRERNAALVDFFKLEDASQALKSMNGKRIGGVQVRVDFLRSQPLKRQEQRSVSRDGQFLGRSMGPFDSPWMLQDFNINYSEPSYSDSKIQQHSKSLGGQKEDGQLSNVLWIGYPPSVHIDEQMLHNAMILFGEIDRIRSFHSMHFCLVEFRSVDEARRAKEGLQGRLFNDPRITIMFSSSEHVPGRDFLGFNPGIKGPSPDMFLNELPFRPAQMDIVGHNCPIVPNNFPVPLSLGGIVGQNMPTRPFSPQGSFKPLLSGSEFNDLTAMHKLPDTNPNTLTGGPSWSKSSPVPGMLPSSPVLKPPFRPMSRALDVFEANQIQRESKRLRIDGALPAYDTSFPLKKLGDQGLDLDKLYRLGPQVDGGASGPLAIVGGKHCLGPMGARFSSAVTSQSHPDPDYIWRGVIAKAGTPICYARCIPIGKALETEIPEVVNCSARTGLDMLMKHFAEAVGFKIFFFLPDTEDDFAAYTEFLSYLGAKNRAGVAKFDDGTTLFLVPPSDFLTKILNVTGPERLYGVVLEFPQHARGSTSMQSHSQLIQPQYIDRRQIPSSQTKYDVVPAKVEKVSQMDYNSVLREDSMIPPKNLVHAASNSLSVQPVTRVNTAAVSRAGVTLTPELIATLASLLPGKQNSSDLGSAHPALGTSSLRPSLPPNVARSVKTILPQGRDHQASEQTGHLFQQLGSQINSQAQLPPLLQSYPAVTNAASHSALGVTSSSKIQDLALDLPQQAAVSSRPSTNFAIPFQSGQLAASSQVNLQYQFKVPQNSQKGYGIAHGTDGFDLYNLSVYQQSINSVASSNQVHGANVSRRDNAVPPATEKEILELPNQAQQHQSVLYGSGQGTLDAEGDKNQRYQSTLQLAANLLLQLQQQQPQQQQ